MITYGLPDPENRSQRVRLELTKLHAQSYSVPGVFGSGFTPDCRRVQAWCEPSAKGWTAGLEVAGINVSAVEKLVVAPDPMTAFAELVAWASSRFGIGVTVRIDEEELR